MSDLNTRATLLLRLKDAEAAPREIAWEEFYARYAPVISGFARKMGCRSDQVEDVVQDVLAGFFEAQPRFVYDPARGRLRGYLKTVAWRSLARIRRTANRAETPEDFQPADPRAEQVWDDLWKREQLTAAIESVRKQYEDNATFRAFELLMLRGVAVNEVAIQTGLSVDSVYKARQRVSVAVRERLMALESDEG
jgi:RNA polymerase sigma-70 factor, ECF subfamily